MAVILITGGARSGKSLHAETRTRALGPNPVYIATAQAWDAEMAARIAQHRDRRGPDWHLIEAPLDLCAALDLCGADPALIDCLTLWLGNLMHHDRDWAAEVERLCAALAARTAPVVLVTNEVGMGIVPDNALARAFRDAQGTLNQRVARIADEVEFVVSGLPMRVK
ncbi:bifunctional adenosylcobinamide kinase/adenosylcobinamide-phosphate guanylyltransferase [Falsirhodobacter halotolerans]|uniref:bifunctional adenosylcobinamide kinase/adenosylcobinamide-phosphate guanylyltransferase n=1 Tax=Falsirhodobacter halotolerans TaxID=1146892 RepID=UPI001FD215F2|nr:bifunctional adenosylcobinamide kinase/adenosylcobinamide-phosphate guanylyltransferase [Falsirhodobacter halotolerans]MCJ8139030.1 bifunctional adenosylcobinamide kinase/adenosylcobinamide-phosphate guanylyltransferase [Falsirhodobacter halotolerans]